MIPTQPPLSDKDTHAHGLVESVAIAGRAANVSWRELSALLKEAGVNISHETLRARMNALPKSNMDMAPRGVMDMNPRDLDEYLRRGAEMAAANGCLHRVNHGKPIVFMMKNADYICGWKQAGLSYAKIAEVLTNIGLPAAPKTVKNRYAAVKAESNPERAAKVDLYMQIEFSRASASESSGPVSNHRTNPPQAKPAASPFPALRVADSVARPSAKPFAAATKLRSHGQPELVPIDGEDSDANSELTKSPQSFGDMRRRLFDAVTREQKMYFYFGDGERIDVPAKLHRDIFLARIRSWSELSDRLASL